MDTRSTHAPKPTPFADWQDVAELQRQLVSAVEEIGNMSGDVATAKHVLEYDSDRRKRALSHAMAAPLAGGAAVSKAEAEARASERYGAELKQLGREFELAEKVVRDYESAKLRWETARSLLSMLKEQIKI